MRKWTKTICLVLTVIAVMAISSVTAFAYADESVIDETFTSVETMPDETTEVTEPETEPAPYETEPEKSDDAFSVEGNGEVLDNVTDEKSGKEFYTITTANNNTFYIIIDHASNTNNVYMLSLIDENDLSEFIVEEEAEAPVVDVQPSVDLDDKPSEEPDNKEESKGGNMVGTILIIAVLGAIAGGGYFYFKIYKPKKEAQITDEDMEYMDEGETVNEDEVNEVTSIDELAFHEDDEEE